ncbi:MAG: hypothetical protein ABIV36_21640 [Sphingobium limneticum]
MTKPIETLTPADKATLSAALSPATASAQGAMSAADKAKLDGLSPSQSDPIIEAMGFTVGAYDPRGARGGGAAVYLSLEASLYFRAPALGINGEASYFAPANPDAGGRMATFAKLAITGAAGTVTWAVFDIADRLYKLISHPTRPAIGQIVLGMFKVGSATIQSPNGFRWIEPSEAAGPPVIAPRGAMVVEASTILIPSTYVFTGNSGFILVEPSDGTLYFERDISFEGSVTSRVIFDRSILRAGGTMEQAVRVVTGENAPISSEPDIVVLVSSVNGVVSAPSYNLVGNVPGGAGANQCPYSAGNDVVAMPKRFGDTGTANVVSPQLAALGITRGFTSASGSVFAGMDFTIRPRAGQRMFVRWYLEASVAGQFGTPRIYFIYNSGDSFITGTPVLLRKLSDTLREYGAWVTFDGQDYSHFWAGCDGAAGNQVRMAGLQFYCADRAWWIMRSDYPRPLNMLYPDTMFGTEGRPLRLYPRALMKTGADTQDALVTFASLKTGAVTDSAFVASGADDIVIHPEQLGTTGEIIARPFASADVRGRLPLSILIGPKASSGTVRHHFMGHSIVFREQAMRVGKALIARGLTALAIGTMIANGGGTATNRTWGAEGREGAEIADYVYEHTDFCQPLPVGQESAYLAMTDAQKRGINPYIRPSQAGDNPAFVFNGYIFDFRFYLNRFGFADPTHASILLVRNDIFEADPATTMAQMQRGFAVIYSQMRAAVPSMHIGFVYNGEARSAAKVSDWNSDHYALICQAMALVEQRRAIGDARVWFVPAYAHMSADAGWALKERGVDADSNMTTNVLEDDVHPITTARQQLAEIVADFINATSGAAPVNADAPTTYKGAWNANTNNPPLAAGVGNNGDTLDVSVAGTQSITGAAVAYAVGDRVRFTTNGNKWERFPATSGVTSFSISGGATGYSFTVSNGGVGPVSVTMSGSQTIAGGGTGASTKEGARANLEVPGLAGGNSLTGTQNVQGNILASSDGTSTNAVLIQFSGGAGYVRSNAGPLFVGGEGSNTVRISATALSPVTSGAVSLGTGATRWSLGAFVDLNMSGAFTSKLKIANAGDAVLLLEGDSFVSQIIRSARESASDHAMYLGQSSRGTVAAPAPLGANERMLTVFAQSWDGSTYRNGGGMTVHSGESHSASTFGAYATIWGTANGSGTTAEVARFQPGVGMSMFGANLVIGPNREIIRPQRTFSTLPVQPYRASEWEITDGPNAAPTFGAAAAGGGSTTRPVRSTGTAWLFG